LAARRQFLVGLTYFKSAPKSRHRRTEHINVPENALVVFCHILQWICKNGNFRA